MSVDYKTHIQSRYWQRVKQIKKQSIGYKCQICNKKKHLNVHHTDYSILGSELRYLQTLVVVCEYHHKLIHNSNMKKYKALDPKRNRKPITDVLQLVRDITKTLKNKIKPKISKPKMFI